MLYEAMRWGLPVNTARRGGPDWIVDDSCGVKGDVVDPAQLACDVAAAIRRLAGDPAVRERLGLAGRAKVIAEALWPAKAERLVAEYRAASPRRPGLPEASGRLVSGGTNTEEFMLTLYGVARSRASRPLWLLSEIGMEYAHVPVIQAYRVEHPHKPGAPLNTASPEYLKINPQGQVPCLVDGDLTLTESLGIDLYLASRYGGALGPADDAEEALMVQWALHAATGIEGPALEITLIERDGGAGLPEGQAAIAVAAEKLRRPFRRLEAHLAERDWMVGERFTVADINSTECIRYAAGHPTLLGEFPRLKAWYERCQARDGFKAMWAMRDAEPA